MYSTSRIEPSAPPYQPPNQQGLLNVPPMMYSMPASQQPQPVSTQPTAALRPIPQPPPAPALNEVILSEDRLRVRCPYCQTSITTTVKYQSGTMTHIVALALFVVCCPLAWLPYILDMCKDVDHACPNCGRVIGRFKRFT